MRIGSSIVSPGVREVHQTDASFRLVTANNTGHSFPLGATVFADGVNFSVFSRQASRIDLLLFDDVAAPEPARVIELDVRTHRSYRYWHVFVPGIGPGQVYAYRARGPFLPEHGLRFDPDKVLLDPYGRAVCVPKAYSRPLASRRGDNNATAMKSVVLDPSQYDWEGDAPLQRPFAKTVIYEMHVAGFTRHPSSRVGAELRGLMRA
jgi:glycogen operon protein